MTNLVLDIDAIVYFPEILCYQHPNYKIWICKDYLDDSLNLLGTAKHALLELLKGAQEKGFVSIYEPPIYQFVQEKISTELSNPYLHVAFQYYFPTSYGITAKKAIQSILNDGGVLDSGLHLKAKAVKHEQLLNKTSIIPVLVFSIPFINYGWIFRHIANSSILGTAIFLIVVLLVWSLYKLRKRQRLIYGIMEIIFGLFLIGKVAFASNVKAFSQFDYFSLLSGAYVIIRGLDNTENGMKTFFSSHTLSLWAKIF